MLLEFDVQLSTTEVKKMIASSGDGDGDDSISFREFCTLMKELRFVISLSCFGGFVTFPYCSVYSCTHVIVCNTCII